MVIKTITCHDVYNTGASLQAYALQEYLTKQGHEVQIIDYKPNYLSNHYSYTFVPNPRYQKPVFKQIYLLLKFPSRFVFKHQQRKKNFDCFTTENLRTTSRYNSFQELAENPPEADLFIAGSDQIWNPLFPNGKDPAFYLQFVPTLGIRVSYAASFAVEEIPQEYRDQIKGWLSSFDYISVREKSGLEILDNLGIEGGTAVLDPVFLLDKLSWAKFLTGERDKESYIFVYDFDQNEQIREAAIFLARKFRMKVYTLQKLGYGDKCYDQAGPVEFINLIANAKYVLSNSFHATAFSLIFHKDFWVFNRREAINTRMRDLTEEMGVASRMVVNADEIKRQIMENKKHIDYASVEEKYNALVSSSKAYIQSIVSER